MVKPDTTKTEIWGGGLKKSKMEEERRKIDQTVTVFYVSAKKCNFLL